MTVGNLPFELLVYYRSYGHKFELEPEFDLVVQATSLIFKTVQTYIIQPLQAMELNSKVADNFDVLPFSDNFQGYKSSKMFIDYKNIFG